MGFGKGGERFAPFDAMHDLAVFIEPCRPIAVDLAKSALERVLVQEDVDASEGEHGIVAAGEQRKFDQTRIIVEDLAVGRIATITLDHLAEDRMRRFCDETEAIPNFGIVKAWNE